MGFYFACIVRPESAMFYKQFIFILERFRIFSIHKKKKRELIPKERMKYKRHLV